MTSLAPQLIPTCAELATAVAQASQQGKTIGLVPTMGALHAGHLSLVKASTAECDCTVVSIFVNPTQFAPHEDLEKYPRTLKRDLELLADYNVDFVFSPSADEMYPAGCSTFVDPPEVARSLEGAFRPDHFRGVCTIVLKLLNAARPTIAFFGRKDFQQALVIRRMAEDLNVPTNISVQPIIREPDGLAMSSRNQYLSPEERAQALVLSRSLHAAETLVAGGESDAAAVLAAMKELFDQAGVTDIDYLSLACPDTLAPVQTIAGPVVALIACRVGATRLIDNQILTPPPQI